MVKEIGWKFIDFNYWIPELSTCSRVSMHTSVCMGVGGMCVGGCGYASTVTNGIAGAQGRCPTGVQGALRQLVNSANRLLGECRSHVLSHAHSLDPKFVTQQVIQCAYDIAKGAKALVSHFQ